MTYIWHYERSPDHGILYATEIGEVELIAHFDFPTEEIRDSSGTLLDVNIKFMDEYRDYLFLQLVQAFFLLAIGRSRRGFILRDAPITMDHDALVAEGLSLEERVRAEIQDTSAWFHAIGT